MEDAHITPIPKIADPVFEPDFRPISLLSPLGKCFVKGMARAILRSSYLIWRANNQFGFLHGRSTMNAIEFVIEQWCQAIDKNKPIIAIFFDFAKAFDLVDHEVLLTKLQKLLSQFLESWIASYLTDRRQRVKSKSFAGNWLRVEAGVIQGSVLGPILFIIFISDLHTFLPINANISKYADDIQATVFAQDIQNHLP